MKPASSLFSIFIFLVALISTHHSWAASSSDDVNTSNNPLAPVIRLDLQDYITPSIYGANDGANTLAFRGSVPFRIGPAKQIAAISLPYATVPSPDGGTVSGVGDLNIYDLFLVGSAGLHVGVGPYLTVPTASKDETGTGKWQIGAAAVIIYPDPAGILGVIVSYQHDFAGDSDRDIQNNFNLKPYLTYNLPDSFYLRSSATWRFHMEKGDYHVPIGIGLGKVWQINNGSMLNFSAEQQWTLWHQGIAPSFQTFVGLGLQVLLK